MNQMQMPGPMPGQSPMPGQAPAQGIQQVLPAMQSKGQQTATPQAMVGPLSQMHMQQLMQLMLNPRPEGPPLYAVISAITEKQKQAQAQANMQRQMAMAQGQQAAQQPPVAQQVMQAAMQQAPVGAAQGGIMQGYAGGGAVAFQYGGATLPRLTGESDEDYAIRMSSLPQQPGETDRQYQRRIYSGVTRGKDVIAPELPLTAQQRERQQATELQQASQAAPGYGSGIDAVLAAEKARQQGVTRNLGIGQPRLEAAPAPAQAAGAPITGLPALSAARQAEIQKDQEEAARLAKSREEFLKGTATQSPEVLASRERLQKILSGAYDPQRQALEEAKAEKARGLRGYAEALGFMAARASRGRRAGQVLGEAAGAAAEFMGEQRKRIQTLQDEYNRLSSQLTVTMAQAEHADTVGDDKLRRDALAKAEDIKAELFNTQRNIRKEAVAEQVQQATGIAALRKASADETSARAQMISAGKPTDAQARESLFRRDPKAYEAMYGAKESVAVANLVRAVNTDPALKSYAEALKLNMPNAEASYNARYKELVAMYAPELLLGAGGGGGDSSARAAADKILSGK